MSPTSRALGRVSDTVKGPSFSTWPFNVIPWNAWLLTLALSEMEEKARQAWEQKWGRGDGKKGRVRDRRDSATG